MGGGWSRPHPSHYTHRKTDMIPTVQEAGWAPGLVWTGVENVSSTWIKLSDHPVHSELL